MSRNEEFSTVAKEIADEMSVLVKNHVWKKIGENGISVTSKVADIASGFFFAATPLTAGVSSIIGCSLVGASAAMEITKLAVKEINARSLDKKFNQLDSKFNSTKNEFVIKTTPNGEESENNNNNNSNNNS